MQTDYAFTQDDLMSPVYCTGCHAHIPRAVSDAGDGLCPDCLAARHTEPAQEAQPAAQPQSPQPARASRQARGTLTRIPHAPCPACDARGVVQDETTVKFWLKDFVGRLSFVLVLIGGVGKLFLTLFASKSAEGVAEVAIAAAGVALGVLALMIPRRVATGMHRECPFCGHRWSV